MRQQKLRDVSITATSCAAFLSLRAALLLWCVITDLDFDETTQLALLCLYCGLEFVPVVLVLRAYSAMPPRPWRPDFSAVGVGDAPTATLPAASARESKARTPPRAARSGGDACMNTMPLLPPGVEVESGDYGGTS